MRIALVVAVVWVGFKVAEPYFKYWQLKDTMDQAARFAQNLTDADIRRRVVAEVRQLDLPQEAERVYIRREPNQKITIWLQYTVTLHLPRYERKLTFKPVAEAPL